MKWFILLAIVPLIYLSGCTSQPGIILSPPAGNETIILTHVNTTLFIWNGTALSDLNMMDFSIVNSSWLNGTNLNVTQICFGGVCQISWPINSTADVIAAINNSGYYNISVAVSSYINNVTERTLFTDTYNSTYNTWSYNQTTPAISWVAAQNFLKNFTETDPLWSANYSALNTTWSLTYNSTYDALSAGSANNSWNETLANELYYAISNPLNFLNITYNSSYEWFDNSTIFLTYNSSYMTNTYNSTYDSFNYRINDTLIQTYNSTYDAIIGDNQTWNETLGNELFYSILNPYGFISSFTELDSLWSANYSALNTTWSLTYNSTYDTYNYRANNSLLETYNVTYDALVVGSANNSWNETLANELYYAISNPLNFLNITYNSSYEWFDNSTIFLTYNTTYDALASPDIYNASYEYWNNITFNTTYNSTYDTYNYRVNSSLINTYNSTYDTYDYRINTSLLTNLNTTINQWLYNQSQPVMTWAGARFITLNNTSLITTATAFDGHVSGVYNAISIGAGKINNTMLASTLLINIGNISRPFDARGNITAGTINSTHLVANLGLLWANLTGFTSVNTNGGLAGGGDLSATRTITLSPTLSLNWGNLSTYNLNSAWTGTLGAGNVTAGSLIGVTDVNATNLNASDKVRTHLICFNEACSSNISYNGTHTIWY